MRAARGGGDVHRRRRRRRVRRGGARGPSRGRRDARSADLGRADGRRPDPGRRRTARRRSSSLPAQTVHSPMSSSRITTPCSASSRSRTPRCSSAWEQCTGLFCLNAAPAARSRVDPDLCVVNRYELESLSRRDGLVAVTLGAEGAVLLEDGEEVARAAPPAVDVVDGTAAGDAFTACLLVSLLEGREPAGGARASVRCGRARGIALRRSAVAADRRRDRRDHRG